jgi:trimeric autotransporter adhesin
MKKATQNPQNNLLKTICSVSLLLVMIPGVLAQETASDERSGVFDKEDVNKTKAEPDKAANYRLNVVGSDALIYGLTIGRGGSNLSTNTAFGGSVLLLNSSGHRNTAIGSEALSDNTTGTWNTAVGRWALRYNARGNDNVGVGFVALRDNQGHHNTVVGTAAMMYNTMGYSNVAMGASALHYSTALNNLVAVGDSALYNNGLNSTQVWHGSGNTALGSKALYANTTGSRNTATGYQNLNFNTTGFGNTASGYQALLNNTTGYGNTVSGHLALSSNTTGYYNTALGSSALSKITEGGYNTGTGYFSLFDLTSGSSNTAIGSHAGDWVSSISFGTFVGVGASPFASGFSNITGIGYNARPTASNQVRIGNTSVVSIGGNANWTNFSDGGYKNNVKEDVAGLDFILKLRPVSYNLDVHKLAADLQEDLTRAEDGSKATAVPDEITQKSRDEKAAIRYTGFVAQEVEATVNELGVAFSGVDAPVNKSGHYGLRYSDFVVPLVKAVQEQQAQIEALSPEGMDALREELSELRAENVRLQGQINDIISQLEILGVDVSQSMGYGINHSQQQYFSGNARLEQNSPNPFHENTVIRYFLPEGTQRAQILITDMAGTQVMALPLELQGAGQVLIHGGSLTTGTYVYTLVVDGRKVESKRMILL